MKNYHLTDPEFAERFEHFAFEEVVHEKGQTLDEVTRHMAVLAALLGCQGVDAFRLEVPRALDAGVTPVMVKEIVYQAVDYLGIGRVLPFLDAVNDILTDRGIGHNHYGRPAGKRSAGPGRYFRQSHERSVENGTHQPLACFQLLWRLLHPEGA